MGDRHALHLVPASGGWELRVVDDQDVPLGSAVVTPIVIGKLVRKGITVAGIPLEIRGLKWEIEFRLEGLIVGRVRKDDFLIAISSVPPG